MSTRVPLWSSFVRLYRGDGLFRSSLDFAVIGMAVYLFIAPLPLPSLGWLAGSGAGATGAHAAPSGTTPPAAATAVPGIAQAANPHNGQQPAAFKVSRAWFKLSDPEIEPMLNKAADLVERRDGSAALAVLNEIGRPDDPNVANLSAYGYLLVRDKDAMQRAYDAHLRAAQAGHPESMHQVGQMLRLGSAGHIDLAAAVDWYEKSAAAGSAEGATLAGRAYVNGWSRPVDYAKGASYYRMGAERGDLWGMNNLGALYFNGNGVTADRAAGRDWFEKAASGGLVAAKHNMATMLHKGLGGPRDIDGFLKWDQEAANQGYAPALYDLGIFYLEPDDGRSADAARAAVYLRQAAVKRHPPAEFALATLYDRGVGMPPNPVQAFVYYSLALRSGEPAAKERLDALRLRMNALDLENAQKLVAAASS